MDNGQWNSEVKVNKDILKYKEQVILGLNLKQTVCGINTILISVLVFFLCHKSLGTQGAIILGAVLVSPIAAIGFMEFNGMSFAQLFRAAFEHFLMPDKLFFKANNLYKKLIEEAQQIQAKEKKKRVKNVQTDEKNGA